MADGPQDPQGELDNRQEEPDESSPDRSESPQPNNDSQPNGPGLIRWLQEDWLLKLGALFVILAVAWFISEAVSRNWVGPIVLLTIGLLFGLCVSVGGFWLMNHRTNQGAVLKVLGSLIIIATVAGAQFQEQFFDTEQVKGALFPPVVALGIMFLSLVATTVASVAYRVYWMSVVALIAGMYIPNFVTPGEAQMNVLLEFTYYLILVLGTLWTVFVTKWRSLTLIALLLMGYRSFGYWVTQGLGEGEFPQGDEQGVLAIGFALVLAFFITNTANIIQNQNERSVADLFSAGLNGLFLLGWVFAFLPGPWNSLALLAWAIVFVGGAVGIARRTNDMFPVILYGAISVMLVGVATVLQFDGPALKIALMLEVAAIVWASYPLVRNVKVTENLSLLFVIPLGLSLTHLFSEKWGESVWHGDFAVLAMLMVVLLFAGGYIKGLRASVASTEEEGGPMANVLLILASLYFFALIWLVSHSIEALQDGFATGLSLALYAISGLALYILGDTKGFLEVRVYGAIIFAAVIARLLIVDVWVMSTLPRIATFFFLGLIFIGVALVWKREHESKPEEERPEQPEKDLSGGEQDELE